MKNKFFAVILSMLFLFQLSACFKVPEKNATSSQDYVSFFEKTGIQSIAESNPIDNDYYSEINDIYDTDSIHKITNRYIDAWKTEIINAIDLLSDKMDKKFLIESQEAWENVAQNEYEIEIDVIEQSSVGYGTEHKILVGNKLLNNTRLRALMLIECVCVLYGKYDFVWGA
ncbi:MAG: hypothetical protein LBQ80_04835 [Clostridium sp.]|jgi:hypothetical protein|nr:hypothetical protein [Clostridium sp.]